MDDYDVFLNHRGPDVKAGFDAHLDEALRQAGLNPFLDKASLKKGDYAFGGIDKALEVARVHVAVVSRRVCLQLHSRNIEGGRQRRDWKSGFMLFANWQTSQRLYSGCLITKDMSQNIREVEESHLWEDKAMKVVKDGNQIINRARSMNLTMNGTHDIDLKEFPTMPNLHYLIIDGCKVHGNFGRISKELRYLQWKHMPSLCILSQNLFILISLDFSESSTLANVWINFEGFPNMFRLNMENCSSIIVLPNSIRCLSRL